jgi:hypothetical protein
MLEQVIQSNYILVLLSSVLVSLGEVRSGYVSLGQISTA